MAKAPAKKPAARKTKAPSKPKAPARKKSPTDEFYHITPIEKIEQALERLERQEADPLAEPLSKQQIYWWVVWTNQLPDAKSRGLTHVPTCSIEGAVLGLFDK